MHKGHLNATSLYFGYGTAPVLHGLNLSFQPGLFHAVVGPNGCGKSTLLGLLAGHLCPNQGRAELDAMAVREYAPAKLARRLALVGQELIADFPFTVFETVLMGRHPRIPRFSRPQADDLAITEQSLIAMDMTHLRDRVLADLSGGERQRTMVARGLAQDTPVLLLDEPTASMDIRHGLATMTELRRLAHERGKTVVTVLHDLNLALRFCDRTVMLDAGKVHAMGSTAETLTPANIRAVFKVRASVLDTGEGPAVTYSQEAL